MAKIGETVTFRLGVSEQTSRHTLGMFSEPAVLIRPSVTPSTTGDRQPILRRCVGKSIVVGEQHADVLTDTKGGREMDGVEGSEERRAERSGLIEDRIVQGQEGNALEPFPSIVCVGRSVPSAGPNRLGRQQRARYVSLPFRERLTQPNLLGLV